LYKNVKKEEKSILVSGDKVDFDELFKLVKLAKT
jgi:hypothetical protein